MDLRIYLPKKLRLLKIFLIVFFVVKNSIHHKILPLLVNRVRLAQQLVQFWHIFLVHFAEVYEILESFANS
jgi:hypothetical protein